MISMLAGEVYQDYEEEKKTKYDFLVVHRGRLTILRVDALAVD